MDQAPFQPLGIQDQKGSCAHGPDISVEKAVYQQNNSNKMERRVSMGNNHEIEQAGISGISLN